jgi:hypothetical protein
VSLIRRFVDERFLTHRLRSSSTAGIAAGIFAIVLFEYRFFHDRIWSWDLLAVALTFVGAKLGLMAWYSLTD